MKENRIKTQIEGAHKAALSSNGKRKTKSSFEVSWHDRLPRAKSRILYILVGYGCVYAGESGDGVNRFYSTIREKPWADHFFWFNLLEHGIDCAHERKEIEALTISYLLNKSNRNPRFCLMNRSYTRTLGIFSKNNPNIYMLEEILEIFIERINYLLTDGETYSKEEVVAEIWTIC